MPKHKEVWPTTPDNPFDPFTQFARWYDFDRSMGYNTCEQLAYLAKVASNLTDNEYEWCADMAIYMLIDWYSPYQIYTLAVEGKTQRFGLYDERKQTNASTKE